MRRVGSVLAPSDDAFTVCCGTNGAENVALSSIWTVSVAAPDTSSPCGQGGGC